MTMTPSKVMCPDKKLRYFEQNADWRADDVTEVKQLVEARWQDSYAVEDLMSTDVLSVKQVPSLVQVRPVQDCFLGLSLDVLTIFLSAQSGPENVPAWQAHHQHCRTIALNCT